MWQGKRRRSLAPTLGETAVSDPVTPATAIQVGDRLILSAAFSADLPANTVLRVASLLLKGGKTSFILEIPPKKPPETDDDDPEYAPDLESVSLDQLVEFKAIRIASEDKGAMEAAPAAAALAVPAGEVAHLPLLLADVHNVVYNAAWVRLPVWSLLTSTMDSLACPCPSTLGPFARQDLKAKDPEGQKILVPFGSRGIVQAIGNGTNSPGCRSQVEVNYLLKKKPGKDGAVT